MSLKDKVAIVTGATRGIGKEILIDLATKGVKVVGIYARSETAANELQENLSNNGCEVEFLKVKWTMLNLLIQ